MCPHGLEIRDVGRQRALHSLPEDAQPRGHTEVFTVGHTSGLGWYALQIYRMTNSAGATPTAEGTPVFWNKACTTAEPAAHCGGMSASLQSAVARQLGRSTHVREVRKVDPVAIMPARPTCARPRAGWAWMQHEFRPVARWRRLDRPRIAMSAMLKLSPAKYWAVASRASMTPYCRRTCRVPEVCSLVV